MPDDIDELYFDPDDFSLTGSLEDEDDYWISDPDFEDLDFSDNGGEPPELLLDVPYVPTDTKIVQAMLDLAEITNKDYLYDLGCGDGRIVVTAALERGTRGIGIDLDPMRIAEAMELAGNSMVEHMTDFFEADLMEVDFSEATVITLYLLDMVNVELRPRLLEELKPGTRIVSHAFDMADWKPDRHVRLGSVNLYKWIIPARVAGCWQWQHENGDTYQIKLKQKFQQLSGQAWINGEEVKLHRARIYGDLLELGIKPAHQGAAVNFVMRWQKNNQLLPVDNHGQKGAAIKIDTITANK